MGTLQTPYLSSLSPLHNTPIICLPSLIRQMRTSQITGEQLTGDSITNNISLVIGDADSIIK